MKKIIVFDFDGTLSAGDINLEFWRYALWRSIRPWIFMPLTMPIYFIGKIFTSNAVWWRELSRLYLSKKLLDRLKPGFVKYHLTNRFGWAAEQVEKEKSTGAIVVLSSASPDYFVTPLVKDMGFDVVLSTITDIKNPWRIKFLNYNKNKVMALKKKFGKFEIVRGYSDSPADLPFMKLAKDKVWINPKTGVRTT
jgi:phosphoserine phosphatase